MIQEKFSLTWDNYTDHLREMHQSMRLSGYLTDVTLVTDDKKQSKAHGVVLSACSPVLKSIINYRKFYRYQIHNLSQGHSTSRNRIHTQFHVPWGNYM